MILNDCCRLAELRLEICGQTELAENELLFVQHDASARSETETVGEVFPATSEEFPVVVTSVSMATWRGVTRMKQTLRECFCAVINTPERERLTRKYHWTDSRLAHQYHGRDGRP